MYHQTAWIILNVSTLITFVPKSRFNVSTFVTFVLKPQNYSDLFHSDFVSVLSNSLVAGSRLWIELAFLLNGREKMKTPLSLDSI